MKFVLNALLLLFLFFIGVNSIHATIYYVSSQKGNDSHDGLSETVDGTHGPWKTLSKVNSSKFAPGDSILLRRGDAWTEQLVVSTSGNPSSSIYYGDYGTGDKPIINCADTITGWSVYNGNIWSASLDTNITSVPQVFMDGKRQIVSRWPNRGWNTIDSISTTSYYLYDMSLNQADNYWAGATLQIRDCDWAVEARTITSSSSGANTISWGTALGWGLKPKTGFGYYIENKLALIDTVGEWFFDAEAHVLYFQVNSGDNPNSHTIEASIRIEGIKSYWKKNIILSNFNVKNSAYHAIKCVGGDVKIVNNDIMGSFNTGIYSAYGENNIIDSNTIENNCRGHGIYVSSISLSQIIDNTINHIATDSISPKAGQGMFLANLVGDVSGNKISNVAWAGITVFGGIVQINNNEIYRCMLLFDDGGGIYMNNDQTGSIIEKNYIHDLPGNTDGVPNSNITTVGLYLDETGSCGAIFRYNIVRDCSIGSLLHKSNSTYLYNNTFYNNKKSSIFLLEPTANLMYNIVIKNNICYAATSSQVCISIARNKNSTNSIGEFNNNLFYNPYRTDVIHYGSWESFPYYTLAEWQSKTGLDAGNDANSIFSDPLFKNVSSNDFHLTSSSPCIDAGINVGIDEDFEGVSIPFGNSPDIGAYECTDSSVGVHLINDDNLLQAYPNPFCNEINIQFQLDKKEKVDLSVFDLNGKKCTQLKFGELMSGSYTAKWDATGKNSGVYIVKLRRNRNEEVKKIIRINEL